MSHSNLPPLEAKLDQLLTLSQQIAEENRELKAQQAILMEEHQQLMENNDEAGRRVEAMIERLKTLTSEP